MTTSREELLTLIAEAYQVIGNLAEGRMVHVDVLPFPSKPPAPAMAV